MLLQRRVKCIKKEKKKKNQNASRTIRDLIRQMLADVIRGMRFQKEFKKKKKKIKISFATRLHDLRMRHV